MKRLVVVGGGISGLAAAQGAIESILDGSGGIVVHVLERDYRVGGKALTLRDGEWLVEAGPTGYLDAEPAMDRLVKAAGLEDELLPADASAANRYLVRGGRMRPIVPHPVKFAASGVLGPLGLLRVLGEPFVRGKRDGSDESVWQFAARRLGRQAADRLIAPMVLGVFAGDAQRLSLPAAFPRLAELEQQHGSLVRGMLARRKEKRKRTGDEGEKSGGPAGPAGWLTSFKSGLQSLPEAIARRGRFEVRCNAEVDALDPAPAGGWRLGIAGDGEPLHADAVVLTGEPWAMAPLLRPLSPDLAAELDGVYCPPVAVVALGFDAKELERVPRGFGVLIPRNEGYRILGCLWDTHLFQGRSPRDGVLVRAMLGGAVDPEAPGLSEEELVRIVRRDLEKLMGIRGEPVFRRVVAWPRAIPQYELGHLEKLARIEKELARHAGLFLAGNAFRGVSFSKSAASGMEAGGKAARWLESPGG